MSNSSRNSQSSRREFIKKSVAGTVAAGTIATPGLSLARSANVGGSDTIRIGLVGCGGRGTQASQQAMNTEGNVELVAVADAFDARAKQCVKNVKGTHGDKVKIKDENIFVGLDAYEKLLATDIEMVLLVTPPGFRPLHFEAAINAGKHVFMEKPVAVDPPGIRRVLKANELAKEKGLAVAVGLQRRHERAYMETIDKLREGVIGDLLVSRVYWNSGLLWQNNRKKDEAELRYQMRNWYYFNWLCGDHIVEQHIHNLDVINWLLDDFPVSAQGQGGRLVRTGPDSGQIYDHHMVEYTYKNGHKMISQCRHMDGCWNKVGEHVLGSKGHCEVNRARIFDTKGDRIFQSKGKRGGHQQEHHDLFAEMRNGVIPNEGEYGAKSTMTSILGRLATYTGKKMKFEDALNSNISLFDPDAMKDWNAKPPVMPNDNGKYPVAYPGKNSDKYIDF